MILNTILLEVMGDAREEGGLGRLPLWYKSENDNLLFSNEYNDDIMNEIAFEITSDLEQEDYYDETDEDPVGVPHNNALSDADSDLSIGAYCDTNAEIEVDLWLAT